MRREKFFCLSLRRFAPASTAALVTFALAGTATADRIRELDFKGGSITGFDVVGTRFATLYSKLSGTMTPVPEPGTLGLLGTGLIALAGLPRRKPKLWI